jgi:hypothetical protein
VLYLHGGSARALVTAIISFCALMSQALAGAPQQERPALEALPISEPPVIDGFLSEPSWEQAPKITALTQVEPRPGELATEVTQVAVLYTSDTLYIGVWCFDRDPSAIIATEMRRDADLDANDRVSLLLDTFLDRRNAYFFQIGAAGGRVDGLIGNNGGTQNDQWDAIWQGATQITDQGWLAEIAIPFQSISFDKELSTWGFNVQRVIKRRLESDRWASPVLDASFNQPARAGELDGLHGMRQGLGIDVRPYAAVKYSDDQIEGTKEITPYTGGEILWRVTPSFTAIFTANTDFAETEVDTRQINLTRFPLFFPEKRDFFLEDTEIFTFADAGDDRSLIPFFSRRIGLVEGTVIPIQWGVKATGRVEDYNIGVLDVHTSSEAGIDDKNLLAARVSRNVFEESDVGFIATRGDPVQSGQNGVLGLDYNYRTTSLFGDKTLRASVYALRSYTTGEVGDDKAYGFRMNYPNDLWSARLNYQVIESNFNPALGFVERTGIKTYSAGVAYEPRLDTWIRQLKFEANPRLVTDSGNQLENWEVPVQVFGMELDAGDEFAVIVTPQYEQFDQPFNIHEGIIVPPGEYDAVRTSVVVSTALKRPVSVDANYSTGRFLTGHLDEYGAEVTWRANRYLEAQVGYFQNDVRLAEGDFVTRIALGRLSLSFSPALSWITFVQYDTESRVLGLNSRVRFILEDARELFLVYNQGWLHPEGGSGFDTQNQTAILKLEYSIRF